MPVRIISRNNCTLQYGYFLPTLRGLQNRQKYGEKCVQTEHNKHTTQYQYNKHLCTAG